MTDYQKKYALMTECVRGEVEATEARATDLSILVRRLFRLSRLPDNATPDQVFKQAEKINQTQQEILSLIFAADKSLSDAYMCKQKEAAA